MGVFDSLLNKSYTVTRQVRAGDGQGGWTVSWAAVGTWPGRMRPATSAERELAAAEQRQISHVLYTRPAADILRGDRVAGDGATWEVQGVREPSRADHHLEIDCLERQLEAAT